MRFKALLALLVILVIILAGCTGPSTDGGDDGDGSGDPSPGANDGSGDGNDGSSNRDPNGPAPPTEQEVDDPGEVDRPGEYALLPPAEKRSDASWNVPQWIEGDTWRYRHHVYTQAGGLECDPETEDRVNGSGTSWDVPIYRIVRTEIDCRDGSVAGTKGFNFTMEGLVELDEDGTIEHVFVFPLEDGKRWVYARSDNKGGTQNVNVTARHVPQYLWSETGETVEAWRTVLEYEGDGNVTMRYWIGVEQKNLLRREIWADGDGVSTMFFSSTLISYTHG